MNARRRQAGGISADRLKRHAHSPHSFIEMLLLLRRAPLAPFTELGRARFRHALRDERRRSLHEASQWKGRPHSSARAGLYDYGEAEDDVDGDVEWRLASAISLPILSRREFYAIEGSRADTISSSTRRRPPPAISLPIDLSFGERHLMPPSGCCVL